MTQNTTTDHQAEILFHAISRYLFAAPHNKNSDALRQEMIDLINTQNIDAFNVAHILRSGDSACIEALYNKGHHIRQDIKRTALKQIQFAEISKDQRVKTFRLVAKLIQPSLPNAQKVAHQAISAKDLDLFDKVVAWAPDIPPEQMVWSAKHIDFSDHHEFWIALLSRLDGSNPHSLSYAQDVILKEGSLRPLAVLFAIGLPLRKVAGAINSQPRDGLSPLLLRFLDRASSAHGELVIKSNCPPLEDLLKIPEEHIIALFAGLSNKQKKKIAAYQKAEKAHGARKIPKSLHELSQIANGT